ncbi:hypothetical protein RRF57_011108 [Xylaria bambusicola]|uniref:Uncharacterized protein n=1 Tax=Xylaria bambusicola TaxID=326684 RepID=A0AAN7UZ09_9PEZI
MEYSGLALTFEIGLAPLDVRIPARYKGLLHIVRAIIRECELPNDQVNISLVQGYLLLDVVRRRH